MNQLSKQNLASVGLSLVRQFLEHNGLEYPIYYLTQERGIQGNSCGYFDSSVGTHGMVVVLVDKCAHRNPQFSWPGFISDRTPLGVLAHETGHYVDWKCGDVASRICKLTKEQAITSYAPNSQEWFAEMFRLFVTNPDLLRIIRPKTYVELTKGLGLSPVVTASYQEVLEGAQAPSRVLDRIQRFLK